MFNRITCNTLRSCTLFSGRFLIQFSSVQSLTRVWLFVTPWTAVHQASLSITNSQSFSKLMSIESVMPSIQRLILCHPLILPPSTFPSIRVFSNESALHIRWPKHWSFRLNISPSNEYSGLISTRMDWLDLHAGHGTLKSLLQHHSSKESILLYSAFFIVKLSHAYTTTGKTIALTRWAFVGKVMSLLFNMLPRFIITYENSERLYLGDSNITEVGDCSHEIKRCLLLGNKVMTNLDSILKSRDITLPTKVRLVKAMLFLIVMYGCESWM